MAEGEDPLGVDIFGARPSDGFSNFIDEDDAPSGQQADLLMGPNKVLPPHTGAFMQFGNFWCSYVRTHTPHVRPHPLRRLSQPPKDNNRVGGTCQPVNELIA